MTHHTMYKWFLSLFAVLLLSACGGGGVSTDAITGGTVTQGIAVDPYIVGAVFQEIEPGTGMILQESSPSDETGMFSFDEPLTPGSVVELVPNTGLHGGAPYDGVLRRLVGTDDDGSVVVSPLTTLLANGATPDGLVAAFNDAGLTGLSVADLDADPMAGLAYMTTGVADQDLKLLQASMAANAYMEVTGNFEAGMHELNDASHFEIFSTMVNAMENLLNSQEFGAITTELANDPDVAAAPIFEDYVLAVVAQQQTIIALAREGMTNNGFFDSALVEQAVQDAMGNSFAMVKNAYSQRVPLSVAYDGATLYHDNCSACHGILALTEKPGSTVADIQTAIDQNFGGMGSLSSLTQGEIAAIADVLPAAPASSPTPTPIPAPGPVVIDGATLYGTNCSSCHGQLASTTKPGRTTAEIQTAIDSNLGGMGFLSSLTPEEVQAIADVLPAATTPAPGPDYSDCTACHGQPPSGSNFPDTAGAHAVHIELASVAGDCSVCHLDAAHNGQVDLGFPASFDAKSGPVTDNLDGTCSSIICHGGQTTPDWWTGSIAVETQCTSCHTYGTSQFNSYSSGRHSKHVQDKGFSCTVCHNTEVLQNGHFSNLESTGFELSPAATIGGGSTRVGSYANGTCSSIECHGSKSW
jgi:predicted CxxxxCH...CXXCH cytochrome family protein